MATVRSFEVEELFDFGQADLEDDDVYLLDVYTSIFVWLGSQANETEKRLAPETAAEYAKAEGYSLDTPVVMVHAATERCWQVKRWRCRSSGWRITCWRSSLPSSVPRR